MPFAQDLRGFTPNLNSFYQTHFSDWHWHRNKYCPNQGHTSCLISFRAFLTLNNWTQGSTNVEPHNITAVREASNTPCLSQLKIDGTQSPAGPNWDGDSSCCSKVLMKPKFCSSATCSTLTLYVVWSCLVKVWQSLRSAFQFYSKKLKKLDQDIHFTYGSYMFIFIYVDQ